MHDNNSASAMRIAMFGQKHVFSREGGVEVVVTELATRMSELGYDVTCYDRSGHHVSGCRYDSSIGNTGEYRGITIKRVPTIKRKGLAAITASLAAAVRASLAGYDVVHIHAEGPAAMCRLLKFAHKHVVVTIHGLDWKRAKWGGVASLCIKWGERQAAKHADAIIVLSRNIQEYFRTAYNRETVLIPNGVIRPDVVAAEEITKLWDLEKGSYALFVGRIVPEKGLRCLVEAWKDIRTDKKLVITGGSSDTQSFMDELKTIAGKNVIFTGFQQGRVLEELYSNAYFYILPSDVEGMPLSLLEAMSYGNCCVVSDIPECVEVVEDKAIVFQHGNVQDLRRVLQELLDNPGLVEKYRCETADFICNKYNWDDVVDKTLELYRK